MHSFSFAGFGQPATVQNKRCMQRWPNRPTSSGSRPAKTKETSSFPIAVAVAKAHFSTIFNASEIIHLDRAPRGYRRSVCAGRVRLFRIAGVPKAFLWISFVYHRGHHFEICSLKSWAKVRPECDTYNERERVPDQKRLSKRGPALAKTTCCGADSIEI